MNFRGFKIWIPLLLLWVLTVSETKATHLMGGSLTYQYVNSYISGGQTIYRYNIKIQMFRDCSSNNPSGYPTPFDDLIDVGIYHNNSSGSFYKTITIIGFSEYYVDPPSGGSNCAFKPNVCIRRAIYQTQIELPASADGYHLIHQRCCRNELVNLKDNSGQTYYAFIPPTYLKNNSAFFSGIPLPYICTHDTVSLSYAAIDPDGDSLVYSFVHPNGGGSAYDPIPAMNKVVFPVDQVVFKNAYSVNQPFGANAYAVIDPFSGLVKVMSPQKGLFALAIEVREYRNGTLINAIRRDFEIIVLQCPPNDIPLYHGRTDFFVDAGDTLDFSILYTDSDSMYLTRKGTIFDVSGEISPPYAQLPEVDGKGSLSTSFLWPTACHHGRANPYLFTVNVIDNGCPYKTQTTNFLVRVIPFQGPDRIFGPEKVCAFDTGLIYQVSGLSKESNIKWIVQGGKIEGPDNEEFVKVNWDREGLAKLEVFETNKYGCGPVSVFLNVLVKPLPITNLKDLSFCSPDSVILNMDNVNSNCLFSWSPSAFLNDTTIACPTFQCNNTGDKPMKHSYYLRIENSDGCVNFDTMEILLYPKPDTFSIVGPDAICQNNNYDYSAPNNQGAFFQWFVENGNITDQSKNYQISVFWKDSGSIKALETNIYGCIGDTAKMNVLVIHPDPHIAGPEVVCPNTSNVKYRIQNPADGSVYTWNVLYGARSFTQQDSFLFVDWADSGTALISVIERTKEGCVSELRTFPVTISYHLKTSPVLGKDVVCEFSANEPYSVMEVSGSFYSWTLDGGQVNGSNGKSEIRVDWGNYGKGQVSVLESSYDSVNNKVCLGDTVYLPVLINPNPKTSPIQGQMVACEYDTLHYSVQGFPGSCFFWTISESISFAGQGTSDITVIWPKSGLYQLSVLETSKDACPGQRIDTFVRVNPTPGKPDILGDSIVCYPSSEGFVYEVKGLPNSDYQWNIEGGVFVSNNGNPDISVNWLAPDFGTISVIEISEYGCNSVPAELRVRIDSVALDILVVSTRKENSEEIEVVWKTIHNVHKNNNIYLYKRRPGSESYLVDSFSAITDYFRDALVSTKEYPYYYEIKTSNICNYMVHSATHKSILLKGEKLSEFQVDLSWNAYQGWPVSKYHLYRKSNFDQNYTVVNTCSDTFCNMEIGLDGYIQCYRIVATKEGDESIESWSNELCFTFEPYIHIPNAFSPNSDGVNDVFMVSAHNIKLFNMRIYDRWGTRIFETNSSEQGWDGYFNGEACPQGIYPVIINYQGNEHNKTYVGTITLLK